MQGFCGVHERVRSWLIQFVTSMVALLNPLADFAYFLALTQGRSRAETTTGNQAAVSIGVIMLTSRWFQKLLLPGAVATGGLEVQSARRTPPAKVLTSKSSPGV